MSDAELITDAARLEELRPEWDALAVAASQPTATPAWMLAWWRHCAPPGARLRVVAVRDRGELIGLAPFWIGPGERFGGARLRLLAADFSADVAPLAATDRAWEVATAVGATLAAAEPRPSAVELAPTPLASPWSAALRERWPGPARPIAHRAHVEAAAVVALPGSSFDAWLASRSSRSRSNIRRYRRLFEGDGGTMRLATPETVADDLATFARLHAGRWAGLGDSRLVALGDRLVPLLAEIADGLGAGDRFRLWMLELDGEPICADLWVSAGEQVAGINIGWDERFKRYSAPRLAFLRAIEDACERGERRLDLGWGRLDYKRAYATGEVPVVWDVLLPVDRGLPLALAGEAPAIAGRRLRQSARRMLPAEAAQRLRGLVARG